MKVTKENIDWARSEKRVFLRQSLEIKLIALWVFLIAGVVKLIRQSHRRPELSRGFEHDRGSASGAEAA